MLPPPGPASPVPAYRAPSEAMAMAPIGWGKLAGHDATKVVPLSVLFHTPPDALAAHRVPAAVGSGAMSRIRPPMFVGPIDCQAAEANPGSTAAVRTARRSACLAAAAVAALGTPMPFTR